MANGRETPEQTRARLEARCLRDLMEQGSEDIELDAALIRPVVVKIVEAARTEAVNGTATAWEQAYERRIGSETRVLRDRLVELGFIERTRDDDDRETAERLFDEARDRSASGDLRGAESRYEKALELYERLGNEHAAGVCIMNLGRIDAKLERFDAALRRLERAAEIQNRLGYQESAGQAFLELGQLAKRLGDRDGARELFVKALTRYTNAGLREGEEAQWLMRAIRDL